MATKSRKDPRAVVRLVARYRSPTVFEFVDEECYDLSIGGMFVKSPAPAPAGTLLKLECDVVGQEAQIKGVARVVWARKQAGREGPSGMGVKFVKLETGSKELIEEIVDSVGSAGLDPEQESLRGTGVSQPAPEAPIARHGRSEEPPAGGDSETGAEATDASTAADLPNGASDGETLDGSDPDVAGSEALSAAATEGMAASDPTADDDTAGTPASAPSEEEADDDDAPESSTEASTGADVGEPLAAAAAESAGAASVQPDDGGAEDKGGGRGWMLLLVLGAIAVAIAAFVMSRNGDKGDDSRASVTTPAPEPVPAAAPQAPAAASPTEANAGNAAGTATEAATDGADTEAPALAADTPEEGTPTDDSATAAEGGLERAAAANDDGEGVDGEGVDGQGADGESADGESDPAEATDEPGATGEAEGAADQASAQAAEQDGATSPGDAPQGQASAATAVDDTGSAAQGTAGAATTDGDDGDSPNYMLEVITTPRGALVTAGKHETIAPVVLNMGKLQRPVRVLAEMPGRKATAAVVKRSMFKPTKKGRRYKKLYLKLKPE